MAKASANVVFSLATRNRFWFGMISRVSTTLSSSAMPASAKRIRRWPSKWNGLVTTPMVRMPSARAVLAIMGAAPVPVPPPMPAVTNTMLAPERWSRISSRTSCAAAAPTSGCEPAPKPCVTWVPIWMMRCAFDMASACASVLATMKSTPCRPAAIMLLTALPPAPPTPNTIMRAFISRISVMSVIFASRLLRQAGNERTRIATYKPCGLLPLWSRLDVPVGAQLFRGCRSSRRLGHRSAEPPPQLQAVPSPPWLPQSRRSPAAAQPSDDRRARARARKLLCDRLPLLRAARSPPSMPRSLPLMGRCCLPGDHLVAEAYAAFQRDQRSPGLCHHPKVSAATGVAWQANKRPLARFSGGHLVLLSQKVAFYEVGWNQLNGEIHVSTEAAMGHRRSGTIESRFAEYVEGLVSVIGHADRAQPLRDYCAGLMMPCERKSVEPLAAVTAPARVAAQHQSLLHFVGEGHWSDEAVLAKVREMVLPEIERRGPIEAWIIDDTGFPKKGRHSVGVARQYCGQLGKEDNCQVAVSLSLANDHASLPVTYRLYLPQEWTSDDERPPCADVRHRSSI